MSNPTPPTEDGRSGWTAGQWHVDPKAPENCFFDDVNILRWDGLAVAVALHNGDIRPEEAQAAARLIAAAPDMAELLLWIAVFAQMRSEDDSKIFARVNRGALRTIAEKCRAAISRADRP